MNRRKRAEERRRLMPISADPRLYRALKARSERTGVPMARIVEHALMAQIDEIKDAMRTV